MKPQLTPSILILFGITGDLAQRKLLPSLYHLMKDGLLHEDTVILGITRRQVTAEELLGKVELCVNEIDKVCDPAGLTKVKNALRMHQMSLTDPDEYTELLQVLHAIESEKGSCMSRLYYLSIPPRMFEPIVRNLGLHGHNAGCQHSTAASRLMVEKPFGFDSKSAEMLIAETSEWFTEEQVFRIDHYVAKNSVQDILEFRSFDPYVETIWNAGAIKSIEVTAFEDIGIEGRAVFYDHTGALRDSIQSHLLQVLAIVTMDLPAGSGSAAIHAAKQAVLDTILPIPLEDVSSRAVRGQYEGYTNEVDNPESITETYASLQLYSNSERWRDVPMTVRTGKAMAGKLTEVRVHFNTSADTDASGDNVLVFRIQPEKPIELQMSTDSADGHNLQTTVAEFNASRPKTERSTTPEAYETVILDAVRGDHTLFISNQEVITSWKIIENVLTAWAASGEEMTVYPKGSAAVD